MVGPCLSCLPLNAYALIYTGLPPGLFAFHHQIIEKCSNRIIKFFLENKLVTVLLLVLIVAWVSQRHLLIGICLLFPGIPCQWMPFLILEKISKSSLPRWMRKVPQDVEDQITYPLTTALLGLPGVNSVRSSSAFGFSSIYIIFDEEVEFYWSGPGFWKN